MRGAGEINSPLNFERPLRDRRWKKGGPFFSDVEVTKVYKMATGKGTAVRRAKRQFIEEVPEQK